MFEFGIIQRYIFPRSFAASFLSSVSLIVISLVSWLGLVFLSVSEGIGRSWIHKLTALHAPLRILPTDLYTSHYDIELLRREKGVLQKSSSGETPPEILLEILEKLSQHHPDLLFSDYLSSAALLDLEIWQGGSSIKRVQQPVYITSLDSTIQVDWIDKEPLIEGIYLPKQFKDLGAKKGDVGKLIYEQFNHLSFLEEELPFAIAGFYDPGILSIGPRALLAPYEVVADLNASLTSDDLLTSGVRILCPLNKVESIQKELQEKLKAKGVDAYFTVASYKEYRATKELFLQFSSDKILFSFVAILILFVGACSIISLIIVLIQERRREVGMMKAMGASPTSIRFIFAILSGLLALFGVLLGFLFASITLFYLEPILNTLSWLQGYAPLFGGEIPKQLSLESLFIVFLTTPLFSLAGGWLASSKIAKANPAELLVMGNG